MIPPLKVRRTQEDGFDRGRKPGTWFAMTKARKGVLLVGLLVAPRDTTPQVDPSSPNLRLQHAGATEQKPPAMAGAVEDLDRFTLARLNSGTAGEGGLAGGRLEDNSSSSSGHRGPNARSRACAAGAAAATAAAAADADADATAADGADGGGGGDPSTTYRLPNPNLDGRQAAAQALAFRPLFGSHPDAGDDDGDGAGTRRNSYHDGNGGCPFANEPDSSEARAYWRDVLQSGVIALGPQDAAVLTTRDVYDALDSFGAILSCCPGVVVNARSNGSHVPPSPSSSCGLVDVVSVLDRSSARSTGGRRDGASNLAYDLVTMFSWALRAARLPSVALRVLHDAETFDLTSSQRASWDRETAMVLLQMGKVDEATVRLKSAVALNEGDLRALQPLGSALVAQGSFAEGFHYLRTAADLQSKNIASVFGKILEDEGLDPSILQAKAQQEVLVTQRDWMAMYLGWVLQGKWKEIGSSVHVLRRVHNFLERHFSMDSEISFMLGRDLAKRGFRKESWDYLSNAAAPWNRQIYRVRATLSIPAVASSRQDLALAMTSLEHGINRLQPAFHSETYFCGSSPCRHHREGSPTAHRSNGGRQHQAGFGSGGGGIGIATEEGGKRLSTCSFGGLNYPDVAFDELPLLAFADHFVRRQKTESVDGEGDGQGGQREFKASRLPWDKLAVDEGGAGAELVEGGGEASLFGPIGHLFWRLCPDLGEFVAPWLEAFSGPSGLAPSPPPPPTRESDRGRRLGKAEGRVRVAFVSSRFGDHGTTRALAGLMRLLPRDYFEVIIASWPTPADDWTEEHVLTQVEKRPVNLVKNRTTSLHRLANRRPDVVVFADASVDRKTYFLAFGRVSPVQIALWGHAPTLGIPSIDYYVVPESLAADAWNDNANPTSEEDDVCSSDSDVFNFGEDCATSAAAAAGGGDDTLLGDDGYGGDNDLYPCDGVPIDFSGGGCQEGGLGLLCDEGGPSMKGMGEPALVEGLEGRFAEEEGRGGVDARRGLSVSRGKGRELDEIIRTKRSSPEFGVQNMGTLDGLHVEFVSAATAAAFERASKGSSKHEEEEEYIRRRFQEFSDDDDDDDDDDDNGDGFGDVCMTFDGSSAECGAVDDDDCDDYDAAATMHPAARLGKTPPSQGRGGAGDTAHRHRASAKESRGMRKRYPLREENNREEKEEEDDEGQGGRGTAGLKRQELERYIKNHVSGPGVIVIGGQKFHGDSVGDDNDDDDDWVAFEGEAEAGLDEHVGLGLDDDDEGVFSKEAAFSNFREESDDRHHHLHHHHHHHRVYREERERSSSPPSSSSTTTTTAATVGEFESDWPPSWADVEYAGSVEEQVVMLEGLGPFVTPPGWGGRLGTGKLARAADGAEVRRRHLLPAASRLAVLPISVQHFHPDFDEAVGMLVDRHPHIHVIVAVEETAPETFGTEAFGTEGDFFKHDVLQYASPPVWTEKLRQRLARRLGDDAWRLHFLPPLDSWDFFALLGAAHVVLDPFPVGNLHPAVDAFALGTPVVTLPSRQRAGARYVQALASDLGVPASFCAAANVKHYVDLAARLCLDEPWASEVSEILDYVRDWVYLHPSAPRSRPGRRPERHPSNNNNDNRNGFEAFVDDNDDDDDGGEDDGEGEFLPSTGGEEHVQEWAEFLWRVARPGVPVGVPLDVQDDEEEDAVTRRRRVDEQGGHGGGDRGSGSGASGECRPPPGRGQVCSGGGGGGGGGGGSSDACRVGATRPTAGRCPGGCRRSCPADGLRECPAR